MKISFWACEYDFHELIHNDKTVSAKVVPIYYVKVLKNMSCPWSTVPICIVLSRHYTPGRQSTVRIPGFNE